MVNLSSLWYPLIYRDLYDIRFLGSDWLTRVFRGNFVTLVVGSQEPSGTKLLYTIIINTTL